MCNADAGKKELKGDERKAFMKDCLSSKHDSAMAASPMAATPMAASPMTTQQNKMKTCNADQKAKTLKGDERKAFMKSCLSGN